MISGTTITVEGPVSFPFFFKPPLVFPAKRSSASVTLPVCLIFPLLTPPRWLVVAAWMFQPAAALRRGAALALLFRQLAGSASTWTEGGMFPLSDGVLGYWRRAASVGVEEEDSRRSTE